MWYIIGFAIFLVIVWLLALKLFPHTITLKEGLIMLGIQSIVLSAAIFGSLYGQGADKQIINGEVVNKYNERVSCEHSYQCNCVNICSGTGSSRSCSRVCQTCYEHAYDIDWVVKSNIGSLTINRVNRQGTEEPPRFTAVEVGEPFALEDSYYNYIKASPFSIFNKSQLDSQVQTPSYIGVHDYYRINRVVNFGSDFKDIGELNDLLNNALKTLGPTKRVNIVVILHNKGKSFSETLKAKHLGGKINDVYVVLGLDKEGVFNDVAVFSWSKSDLVNVKIRDDLLDLGKYDAKMINNILEKDISQYYVARSIEEFKYLEEDVEIPTWAIWFVMLFGTLFPFVSSWIAHKHEIA